MLNDRTLRHSTCVADSIARGDNKFVVTRRTSRRESESSSMPNSTMLMPSDSLSFKV